ncbi:MAG: glutamine-hydrolyzing carbamoyl-phosphate synthase small subunit [Spirochaetales bacterium]|jgi:carbamoyl-phosphate synthase small subunit|nr:glutamine-hydrolyzing carbamoyl-phosphate synthase small subunit [Spirochaetales bacterium]
MQKRRLKNTTEMNGEKAFLLTEDGTVFPGRSFGAPAPRAEELENPEFRRTLIGENRAAGEVMFNTAMCGYYEALTDPSYTGQIITLTYPLAGNYGCREDWSETLTPARRPGRLVKSAGLVVRSLYDGWVPPGRITLSRFLAENGVPGLTEADTRALTLKIREEGMPRGLLLRPSRPGENLGEGEKALALDFLRAFPLMSGRSLAPSQAVGEAVDYPSQGGPRLVLVDCGLKENILRRLLESGCGVSVLPPGAGAAEILAHKPQGVFFSNGPGDPAALTGLIKTAADLLGRIPLFGVCLGHQILALAAGGRTEKMKFGHHGVNNPVREESTGRVYVTSQNHGFMTAAEGLPPDTRIWFRNANDKTVEGLRNPRLRFACIQFHPEAAPGPRDTYWIFQEFLSMAQEGKPSAGEACHAS